MEGRSLNEKKTFDLLVLGGGPGGYTAAFRAADLGLHVCLVEKKKQLGGVCLNAGCIPSKTLLHCAKVIEEARNMKTFGIGYGAPDINLNDLRAKKNAVIKQLTDGLDGLAESRKVVRVYGTGVFEDRHTLKVTTEQNEEQIRFDRCIVATGSRPVTLPDQPDHPLIWDAADALDLNFIPKRLLVVGGGVIGLEMAQVYHALGSEITIVEMADRILPPADKDLVQPLFLKFKKIYTILTRAKVTGISTEDETVTVGVEQAGEDKTGEYDAVLVAVGRRPNSGNIGLENTGLNPDSNGFIRVDQQQRTQVDNIFAVGDLVGEPMLAHKAIHQGKVAAEVCAGHAAAFDAMGIPSVAYTIPEVAWVGLTETAAKENNIEYEKGKFPWGASSRALSADAAIGTTKVLFSKETGRLVGAGICGINSGELIQEAVLALEMGADARDIAKTIHAHPTLSETFAFASEMVDGSITDAMPPKKRVET